MSPPTWEGSPCSLRGATHTGSPARSQHCALAALHTCNTVHPQHCALTALRTCSLACVQYCTLAALHTHSIAYSLHRTPAAPRAHSIAHLQQRTLAAPCTRSIARSWHRTLCSLVHLQPPMLPASHAQGLARSQPPTRSVAHVQPLTLAALHTCSPRAGAGSPVPALPAFPCRRLGRSSTFKGNFILIFFLFSETKFVRAEAAAEGVWVGLR